MTVEKGLEEEEVPVMLQLEDPEPEAPPVNPDNPDKIDCHVFCRTAQSKTPEPPQQHQKLTLSVESCRQGYNVVGHLLMLLAFAFSLLLIVLLIYVMD